MRARVTRAPVRLMLAPASSTGVRVMSESVLDCAMTVQRKRALDTLDASDPSAYRSAAHGLDHNARLIATQLH
jgi:hypothetical protein